MKKKKKRKIKNPNSPNLVIKKNKKKPPSVKDKNQTDFSAMGPSIIEL